MTRIPAIVSAFVLMPLSVTLSACVDGAARHPMSTPAPPPAPEDGIASARLGQRVYVDGPGVTPLAVLEDSRCPTDPGVRCVWAGQVRLSIKVELGSGQRDHEITTRTPLHIADGNLQLVEVTPSRTQNGPQTPQDYTFGFRFMGGY